MEPLGHVYIFLDDAVVVGTMIISPIDPRHHAWFYPVGISNLIRKADIGNQCRFNDILQRTDDYNTPRSVVTGIFSEMLCLNHLKLFTVIIKPRGTLSMLNIGLSYQGKDTLLGFQQCGISPTVVPSFSRL